MTFAQGHALLIGVNQYQHAPHLNVTYVLYRNSSYQWINENQVRQLWE